MLKKILCAIGLHNYRIVSWRNEDEGKPYGYKYIQTIYKRECERCGFRNLKIIKK